MAVCWVVEKSIHLLQYPYHTFWVLQRKRHLNIYIIHRERVRERKRKRQKKEREERDRERAETERDRQTDIQTERVSRFLHVALLFMQLRGTRKPLSFGY